MTKTGNNTTREKGLSNGKGYGLLGDEVFFKNLYDCNLFDQMSIFNDRKTNLLIEKCLYSNNL